MESMVKAGESFFSNNKKSLENFGIVGITIVAEEISKFMFFYCPCDYPRNKVYGLCFIIGPAVLLLVAGYLSNRNTWRLTTGLCHRSQRFFGKTGKRAKRFVFTFATIFVQSVVAPSTWITLALLKFFQSLNSRPVHGDYYTCAFWPDPQNQIKLSRNHFQLEKTNGSLPKPCLFNPHPGMFTSDSEAEIIARTLRAESHTIGWMFVSSGMLVAIIVMFCFRCCGRFSYEQTNYINRYRTHEIELFEKKLDEESKKQAESVVDAFFENKKRDKDDWDKISVINDEITKSKDGYPIYSPLQRFVCEEVKSKKDSPIEKFQGLVRFAARKKKIIRKKEQKAQHSVSTETCERTRAANSKQNGSNQEKNQPESSNSIPTVTKAKVEFSAATPYLSNQNTSGQIELKTIKETALADSENNDAPKDSDTSPLLRR